MLKGVFSYEAGFSQFIWAEGIFLREDKGLAYGLGTKARLFTNYSKYCIKWPKNLLTPQAIDIFLE